MTDQKGKRFFLLETYHSIKNNLPPYVMSSVLKLLPVYLVSSLFEIVGLSALFPVIRIIIEPNLIQENAYIRPIYDGLHFSNDTSFVLFLFSSVTLIFVLKNILLYYITKKQVGVAFRMASRISLEKYNYYLNQPYSFHADNNTAILLRNFTQMPFDLVQYLILPFITVLNELFILLLITVLIIAYDPLLFLSLLVFVAPFLYFYSRVYKRKLKEISKQRDEGSSQMFKLGMQSMEAFREIVVFDRLDYFKPLFKKTVDRFGKSISDYYIINSISPKFVETVAVLAIFSIFISGYILNKDLSAMAQFLIVFAIAAFRVIPSMNKVILFSNYIKGSMFIFDQFDLKENKASSNPSPARSTQPLVFQDKLEIRDLSFRFANKQENVLNDLNLTIRKGQTIGVIGASGSGKSTLLNILLRLYEEQRGGIYVDGRKIERADLSAWYQVVSYVPQNITLLDGSIRENIAFGHQETDPELLKKVIRQAQLEPFIAELPEGAETRIGEKGIRISGGQRQRIGIARALYHGGKILIFDEATSALDNETEEMLTEAINNISHEELTIIIVAHRMQTLKYCDKIYKLEKGNIKHE